MDVSVIGGHTRTQRAPPGSCIVFGTRIFMHVLITDFTELF